MHHNNVEREAINREPAPSICVRLLKARQFLFGLSPNPLLRPVQVVCVRPPFRSYLCHFVHKSAVCAPRPQVHICATLSTGPPFDTLSSTGSDLCDFICSVSMFIFYSYVFIHVFFFQHHLATRLQHRFLTHYRSCCFLTKTRRLAIFFNQPNAYVIC